MNRTSAIVMLVALPMLLPNAAAGPEDELCRGVIAQIQWLPPSGIAKHNVYYDPGDDCTYFEVWHQIGLSPNGAGQYQYYYYIEGVPGQWDL